MQPNQHHSQNLPKGKLGEDLAENYLRKKGFRIIDRNFKAHYGEIDLIAYDKDELVFVEVKTRWGTEFGKPEEALTSWKIRSVVKTAQFYMHKHKELNVKQRIDAVAVQLSVQGELKSINHYINITG